VVDVVDYFHAARHRAEAIIVEAGAGQEPAMWGCCFRRSRLKTARRNSSEREGGKKRLPLPPSFQASRRMSGEERQRCDTTISAGAKAPSFPQSLRPGSTNQREAAARRKRDRLRGRGS
jgi:hypothetical protein